MRTGTLSTTAILVLLLASCGGDGGGGISVECGNGQIEGAEECDDGNETPCDGCSPVCENETGFICGDGLLNQVCGEQCDDGNTTPGDGCDASCQPEGPPLVLDGEYSVDIAVDSDTCNLGAGPATTPMEVTEQASLRVDVDIPIGGAGGECNPQAFERDNDTLTLNRSSQQQIGACTVQVDVTTLLTFFPGGSVTGLEIDALSEAGGDCSGLSLPCQVRLNLTGSGCSGCFSCLPGALGFGGPRFGVLGSGAGMRSDLAGD
jgi:cysteine-rich repeat protein